MIVGLDLDLMFATTKVEIKSVSQLVVRWIQRKYEARDEHMACYLAIVEARLRVLDK